MKTQKRAKVGGEVAPNGEFYEGGRFINTIPENQKKEGSTPKKARKVQVEPYVWVIDTRTPLFSIVGGGACYIDRYNPSKGIMPYAPAFEQHGDRMFNGELLSTIQEKCDRFNAGERWVEKE